VGPQIAFDPGPVLACGVRDGPCLLDRGHLRQQPREQRIRQGGDVDARRAGAQRLENVVAREGLASIDDVRAQRAARQRACADFLEVLALTDVDGERDHVGAMALQQPGDSRR
jgi:hypothetical protein